MNQRKKLIEVAIPLEAINLESLLRKQKAPKGWPTSFHKWWAQRPLAAARAVIFAQMVDDPSAYPDLFPTEKKQEKERQRLFAIMRDLVKWENTANEKILAAAREEIWQSWRRACAENADHPQAKDIFDRKKLPIFYDPFAGGGSLPLSAQWLGLESYASDLNPVAVLINKALIEIPPKFVGRCPVNPKSDEEKTLISREWKGVKGMAEDVRYYSNWMREEAVNRIGRLYPNVMVTAELVKERPDLKPYVGKNMTVIAWLWARTVKSPNPAYATVDVPLVTTFVLSTKKGKEAYVEPVIDGGGYRFAVRVGKPKDSNLTNAGTKSGRGTNFKCVMSGTVVNDTYVKSESMAGRMGMKLMAIVAEGDRGRIYLPADIDLEGFRNSTSPKWKPDQPMNRETSDLVSGRGYGFFTWADLYTPRQLVSLTTFSDLIEEARKKVLRDALDNGWSDDGKSLREGGIGANAYADAIAVYLACVVDRMAYYGSSFTTWLPKDNALRDCMPRQALAMTWDFAEGNPFAKSSGDILTCSKVVANYLDVATVDAPARISQADARTAESDCAKFIISTDPPYFNNISYADLSDYFYVWLRHSMRIIFPDLFTTIAVPKVEELVATPHRHGGKSNAEVFFLEGMTQAMQRLAEKVHPAFPVTVYYAFKQSETENESGTASTGWETFLEALIRAGFSISGTWPMRTEGEGRMVASGTNALASSIVLVCRRRGSNASTATRREFVTALKKDLPQSLYHFQVENIAPVDLAQAAIGPGMAVYTRYEKVLDAEGNMLSVRDALALINQTLDEALAEQEGDFDSDSRWALAWFDQLGFNSGEYGVAETLSKAKNTSVSGLVEAGILASKGGKVRLLKPAELPDDWDPTKDKRLTAWEIVHHLIRSLESSGEPAAAVLVAKLGTKAETARELCYRLYTLCERKKRAVEALSYNALVQSWPEITRLAREGGKPRKEQTEIFDTEEKE